MSIIIFLSLFLVLHAIKFAIIQARVLGIAGEKIYECDEIPKNQLYDFIDITNFRIHQENDTHTFIDGSVIFLKAFHRLPGRVYLEHYVRGQWVVEIFDRTYFDMCLAFRNPGEIFYNQTKHFPGCPMKAETEWKFDMLHIRASDKFRENFPTYLTGLWRMTMIMEFFVNGQFKKLVKS